MVLHPLAEMGSLKEGCQEGNPGRLALSTEVPPWCPPTPDRNPGAMAELEPGVT